MKKNFFSRLKNKLNADYGGRYLGVLLEEIIYDYPKILGVLFPNIDRSFYKEFEPERDVSIEYCFGRAKKKKRRADLALLKNNKPVALLEIKYEDEKQSSVDAQLQDYLYFVEKNSKQDSPIGYTYLTKNYPPKEHIALFDSKKANINAMHMTYTQLYSKLGSHAQQSPIIRIFRDFLKENCYMFQTEIDEKGLLLLLLKGFNVKHNHGFGRQVSDKSMEAVPDVLSTLLSNMRVLGDHLMCDFNEYFNVRPSLNFSFNPWYDLNKEVKKHGNKDKEKKADVALSRKSVTGGIFFVGINAKFKMEDSNHWLNVGGGISYALDLSDKSVDTKIFGYTEGKGIDFKEQFNRCNSHMISEKRFYRTLLKLINTTLKQVIQKTGEKPVCKEFIPTLKRFQKDVERQMDTN